MKRVVDIKQHKAESFGYRVLAMPEKFMAVESDSITLGVHIVYYDKERKAIAYNENPECIIGDTIIELETIQKHIIAAIHKPVLWAGEKFPEEYFAPVKVNKEQ